MGAACTPKGSNEEIVETEVQPEEAQDNTERITKILNDYQADNEKLRAQLEEVKNQSDAAVTKNEVKQNEAVIAELEKMKALMETKNRALVRGRVENALLARANSMLTNDSENRVCIQGNLNQHVRKGPTKSASVTIKWVEIHLTEGDINEDDYKAGYVTLIQAESKEDENPKKYEIYDVALEQSEKEQIFYFRVSVVDSESDLVFACESEEQRQDWVKCITDALTEVRDAAKIEIISLKLEFAKERMGIRVEEMVVEETEIDVKEPEVDESAFKGAEQVVNDSENKDADVDKMQTGTGDSNDEEDEKYIERPCQLIVTKITDQDLIDGGLVLDSIVTAINDVTLEGMVYSEQIELLRTTAKPFTLTFEIEKFRKNENNQGIGYSSILKELVADGENSVKTAFNELVKGTPFEKELESSDDPVFTISALLGNQDRLMSLVNNFQVHEDDL